MNPDTFEKATIEILEGSRASERLRVLFNPHEYSIDRSNSFGAAVVPGLGGPLLQFVHGDASTLTMELFFDDFTDAPPSGGDVEVRTQEIVSLMSIDAELHAPPPVRFIWGRLNFKAIIERVSQRNTLFRPSGVPARTTLTVTFKEYKTLVERLEDPRLQSADRSKRRLIIGRGTLWAMSAREYRDPALWRVIARANDLDDPRDVTAGQWVFVPPLQEDSRGTR